MIRTQVSFDKALYERARRTARTLGVSLAELCRRSVAETIARSDADAGKPWMRHVGTVDGAPGDSQTVDEVVYGRGAP